MKLCGGFVGSINENAMDELNSDDGWKQVRWKREGTQLRGARKGTWLACALFARHLHSRPFIADGARGILLRNVLKYLELCHLPTDLVRNRQDSVWSSSWFSCIIKPPSLSPWEYAVRCVFDA